MQTLVSVIISALMVVGSLFYVNETNPAPLGASQTISSLTAKTSIDDADTFAIVDNAGTPTTKKITWGNATSSLQTWFNGIYSPIFSASAGLANLLSDETGSSGGFVRAGSPTISNSILSGVTITSSISTSATTTDTGFVNILSASTAKFGATATSSFSSAGALTLITPLTIANGGTGQTTAQAAIDALLPTQTGNSGKFLTTNGSNASWGSANSRCFFESYASSSWTSKNSYTENRTFSNPIGLTPSVFRITYNSSDPNTTKSGSWGSGVATTTGTSGGAYTTTYLEGAGASFNGHSASSSYFMQTYQHNGTTDQNFINAYVNSVSSSQTVITLTGATMEAEGSKLFFTLEQCI